jgi:hypothetical protein
MKPARMLVKMVKLIKSCRVSEWQLAVDTGDYTCNARLFPLNYLPYTFEHVYINFRDDNYLVVKIRSRPWKMLYAFLH